MTRYEFLAKLREALILELDEAAVKEHVDYYSSYISDELGRGRDEKIILEELGDPWVIARSIISMEETSESGRTVYDTYESVKGKSETKYDDQNTARHYSYATNSKWKLFGLILGIIGVLVLVLAAIGGVISFLAPILVPVIIIRVIIRMINKRK